MLFVSNIRENSFVSYKSLKEMLKSSSVSVLLISIGMVPTCSRRKQQQNVFEILKIISRTSRRKYQSFSNCSLEYFISQSINDAFCKAYTKTFSLAVRLQIGQFEAHASLLLHPLGSRKFPLIRNETNHEGLSRRADSHCWHTRARVSD